MRKCSRSIKLTSPNSLVESSTAASIQTFAIEPGHPIIQIWNEWFRSSVHDHVETINWNSINVLRRGIDEQPNKRKATILITIPFGESTEEAEAVIIKLTAVAKSRDVNVDFEVCASDVGGLWTALGLQARD